MVTHSFPWLGITKAPSLPTCAPGSRSTAALFQWQAHSCLNQPEQWPDLQDTDPHSYGLGFLVQVAVFNNFSFPSLNAQTQAHKAVQSQFIDICFSSVTNTAFCACPGKHRSRNFLQYVISQAERRNVTCSFYFNRFFGLFLSSIAAFAWKLIAEENIILMVVQ